MLLNLHVKNLALIEEIEVDFGKGLSVLTGETGAGKSILLGCVNLALGSRYSGDIIRPGADYALVELSFYADSKEQVQRLKALDVFSDDGTYTISRRLMDGRSTSKINGETISVNTLREAAGILMDVCGQQEHQTLLKKSTHLSLLDAFAGAKASTAKSEVSRSFKAFDKLKKEIESLSKDETARKKELDLLVFEASEIEKASLKEGEDTELEERFKRMRNGKKIQEALEGAHEFTSDEGASALISRALGSIRGISAFDAKAESLWNELSEVDALLNDFNRELNEYSKTLSFSEEEFFETENRLNEINHLKNKYGQDIADILKYLEELEEKIAFINDYEARMAALKKEADSLERELTEKARILTEIRELAAIDLEKAMLAELSGLNFGEVKFKMTLSPKDSCTENGAEEGEFFVSLNPGSPMMPLIQVASGGELSRMMLALKTVLSGYESAKALLFDEIDAGIGGRTAQMVSEKLFRISRKHQVVCITHLAQIAAMADSQYLIEKKTDGTTTTTVIKKLSEDERIAELARMLGGVEITDAVMANAREMRKLAQKSAAEDFRIGHNN
ncbi:MAG: DNA repair protein RecN [Lachnospiraceae bacterium]|jgi:DNA repair protein RecN (Recombination protein N)|nr:DNA repair protein RecN [Lachnospiraceae bacterium]